MSWATPACTAFSARITSSRTRRPRGWGGAVQGLVGIGKIAVMVLESWLAVQIQQAAMSKDDDIRYWPFSHQKNSKF